LEDAEIEEEEKKLRSIEITNRSLSYVFLVLFAFSCVAAAFEYFSNTMWTPYFTVTFLLVLVFTFMVVILQRQVMEKRKVMLMSLERDIRKRDSAREPDHE
jgi:uncharacterized membrane protein YjjP (DUF1212 family)